VYRRVLRIAPEASLDPSFGREIASSIGAEQLRSCIQCGTCSSACPVSPYMDYTPRQIIAMTRAGFKDDVLSSFTIWLCASCYSCAVECPRKISITEVMAALKRMSLREGKYPRRFPTTVLVREFFKIVTKAGRNSEALVIMRLYMKTNPLRSIGKVFFGMRLWLLGRIQFLKDKIEDRAQLHRLLKSVTGPDA
jgi:quinone-modifying oxidoreductase, subunit QmoC